MGEIAEDMTDGTCCSYCGQYFQLPNEESLFTHGYPVLCENCWMESNDEERNGYSKSLAPTI